MSDLNAAIRERLEIRDSGDSTGYDPYFVYDCELVQAAMFAVLDLHKPIWDGQRCDHCRDSVPDCGTEPACWPCETIRAIAEKLGIET